MVIDKQTEAEIIRLFHAEGWRQGTIARQLGVHHSTVSRVLSKNALLPTPRRAPPTKVDAFIPFITRTLNRFPKLNATRIYHMVKERGYTGAPGHFRTIIRRMRPQPKGEAFLQLSTLPGEQAQVDWGYFGKLKIGDAEHRLLAFVMVSHAITSR